MQIFKRFVRDLLAALLIVALVCFALIVPWLHQPTHYHDQPLRDSLSGSIDTLIVGASYSLDGVMPQVLNARADLSAYNLCGSMMPVYGQAFMAQLELARNPVTTVLIELTPDTITGHERGVYGNGDAYIYARLGSFADRIRYLTSCVQPGDAVNVLSRLLTMSLRSLAYRCIGRSEALNESLLGFNPTSVRDVSLTPEEARATKQTMYMFYDLQEENIRELDALVQLCESHGARVIFYYPPVSHGKLWQLCDNDLFFAWAVRYSEAHNAPFFDFNLLKTRYTDFSDETSFSDVSHLCTQGAEIFSVILADALLRYDRAEDLSPLFYDDYTQMLADSPYCAYLQ